MTDEYIYYYNQKTTNLFKNKTKEELPNLIQQTFPFQKVEFEGYFDDANIEGNSITVVSGQGSQIKITAKDPFCELLKFKNADGSSVQIVYKENGIFILRPVGSSPQGVRTTYYFDDVGFGININNVYRWKNEKLWNKPFDIHLLENNKSETFGSLLYYTPDDEDKNQLPYSYSPLYYINNKQITAVQKKEPVILSQPQEAGFVWNNNFKFQSFSDQQYSANKIQQFNFEDTNLLIFDFSNSTCWVGYNKEKQRLTFINYASNRSYQRIYNIDLNDYEIYYLQRNFSFKLKKGVSISEQTVYTGTNLCAYSRLFNDDQSKNIEIEGSCTLSQIKLPLTNDMKYELEGNDIYKILDDNSRIKLDLHWEQIAPTSFPNFYYQNELNYNQELILKSQKYDNNDNAYGYNTLVAINWLWREYWLNGKWEYEWKTNQNSNIKINLSISIKDFIGNQSPSLSDAKILQDNYCISIRDGIWGDYTKAYLSNIQIYIITPPDLRLPPLFSLLEEFPNFTDVRKVRSTTDNNNKAYTYLATLLDIKKKKYLPCLNFSTFYRPYYGTGEELSFYSNLTFATSSYPSIDEIENNSNYPNKQNARDYAILLRRK